MAKDLAKSQTERKHSTEMAGLSNDLKKIQLVEEMEEIYKDGDDNSKDATVDEGEKDVTKLSMSVEKGKSKTKKGKFFERVNRLLF